MVRAPVAPDLDRAACRRHRGGASRTALDRGLVRHPRAAGRRDDLVSIVVQALPFLVLGVVLSGAIAAFVPASFWQRALPSRPSLAVPRGGVRRGAVLPGCECASVPVAGGLIARGVAPAAALTFLLAAPAINPIVIASTLVAFPNDPQMAAARFAASLATAVIMGWLFGSASANGCGCPDATTWWAAATGIPSGSRPPTISCMRVASS